jgi:hypothetical protein
MKGSVLVVVALVLAVGAGFGGGFAAASIHGASSIASSGQVPAITNFMILRPVIENGSGFSGFDTFVLNATEGGTPYQAGFQVNLIEHGYAITLSSGSFYGSLNYTPISFLKDFILGGLVPGNYTLVATVMHGDLSNSMDASLEVLPSVSATISGPHNVNDSSGPVTVTYSASVSGGRGPYSFNWSIMPIFGPGPQNYVLGAEHGSSFNVKFSVNSSNAYYGTNQTFVISLVVTDSLGYSYYYTAESVYGNEGYVVNVTGE